MKGVRTLASVLSVVGTGLACGPSNPSEAGCAGPYEDQGVSAYVLPWAVGETHLVSGGNCGAHPPGTAFEYAYDFAMTTGTAVVAARDGTVIAVEERFSDGTRKPGEENYINVRHSDGTLARYFHLTQNGALVDVDQVVVRGQVIGLSGDTGASSGPHLHFHVQRCSECWDGVPVTFRNTRPHPRGLVEGESYRAEPY